jgi:hypothetical protein
MAKKAPNRAIKTIKGNPITKRLTKNVRDHTEKVFAKTKK